MIRVAFSTVACPEWTLDRVARAAAEYGYSGVELRSFGEGGVELACEPALTDGAKVERLFDDVGVTPCGIATGTRFDAPIMPPVLGHLCPTRNASIEEAKHLIDVAVACRAGYVRVYGFEAPSGKRRVATVRRIVERLTLVCDYARHRDVRVVLENGGAFSTAEQIMEIIDRVDSPLLDAGYDIAAACAAGEDPVDGIRQIGHKLRIARVRDRAGDQPCALGEGDLPCRAFVSEATRGGAAWLVYSWDKLWMPDLADAIEVLPAAAERLVRWAGSQPAGAAA